MVRKTQWVSWWCECVVESPHMMVDFKTDRKERNPQWLTHNDLIRQLGPES